MYLILLLLVRIFISKQETIKKSATLLLNKNSIIDTFEDTILDYQIDYQGVNNITCSFQNLQIGKESLYHFNSQIQDQFRYSFEDGHSMGVNEKILQIAHIGKGVMLINSLGELKFYILENNVFILRSSQYFQQLYGLDQAELAFIEEKLIIIGIQNQWIILPNYSIQNIFQDAILINLQLSAQISKVSKCQIIDSYLILLQQNYQLLIFLFHGNKFYLQQMIEDQQIIDFVIYFERSHYKLYILGNGLSEYEYNIQLNQLEKINQQNDIVGNLLIYSNNNLYLISYTKIKEFDHSIIQQLNNNETDKQKQIIMQDKIFQIINDKNLLFFFGQDIITIIREDESFSKYNQYFQFYIVGAIKLFQIKNDNVFTIAGITTHSFFAYKIYYQEAQLTCQADDSIPTQFEIILKLNRSQCDIKEFEQDNLCPLTLYYNIFIIHTAQIKYIAQWTEKLLLVVLTLIILLGGGQLFFYRRFSRFKTITQQQFTEVEFETQKTTVRKQILQVTDILQEKDFVSQNADRMFQQENGLSI